MKVVNPIDKFNMRDAILDFPKQFSAGIRSAEDIYLKPGALPKPENIIICGMGGSALPGDILVNLQPLDVFVHKDYGLPIQAGNESLIICISYSGNTQETLSAFSEAINKKLPLITITTGGKLEKLAQKYNIPLVKIPPPFIPPRLAIGYQFSALIKILNNHNFLNDKIIEEILELSIKLKPEKWENQGKEIAKKIFKKIPIIYTSKYFQEVGLIWKNSLNETAKIMAITNYFPELNHNEIVGFWKINETQIKNEKLFVLILRDRGDNPQTLKQMEITKGLIKKEGVEIEFIDIEGKNTLEKIFSAIILGYFTSYWLALEYGVDPTLVKTIEEFKKRLAS